MKDKGQTSVCHRCYVKILEREKVIIREVANGEYIYEQYPSEFAIVDKPGSAEMNDQEEGLYF